MMDGDTIFRKKYKEIVQDKCDLKKHVDGIEVAKGKKLQEMSYSQNKFLQKYDKYVNGSLQTCTRPTAVLHVHTATPLPAIATQDGGRRLSMENTRKSSPSSGEERCEGPKRSASGNAPLKGKVGSKDVDVAEHLNETAKLNTGNIRLPSIELEKTDSASMTDDAEDVPDMPAMPPPSYGRTRSNSLGPSMLHKHRTKPQLNPIPRIDEEPVPRGRSQSLGNITQFTERSTSITGKFPGEKATLQGLIERSKGLQKFKYMAQMINIGLKEMDENDEEENNRAHENGNNDLSACRYLRIPKTSLNDTGNCDH